MVVRQQLNMHVVYVTLRLVPRVIRFARIRGLRGTDKPVLAIVVESSSAVWSPQTDISPVLSCPLSCSISYSYDLDFRLHFAREKSLGGILTLFWLKGSNRPLHLWTRRALC